MQLWNFSYTKIGIINPSKARDGIVCNTAAIFITTSDKRFVLVKAIPSGTAIKIAINKAIKEICMCSKLFLVILLYDH